MKAFIQRLRFAIHGLRLFFGKDVNGRIQFSVAILVLISGFIFKINTTEWLLVLLCSALVIALEMVNAAIEKICDYVQPNQHPSIGVIKDIAAGAVLWAAIISAIIGLIIFVPYILAWFDI